MIAPHFSAISASAERADATTAVIGARTEATTAVTAETTGVTGARDPGCSGRQMTRRRLGPFPASAGGARDRPVVPVPWLSRTLLEGGAFAITRVIARRSS